MENRINQLTEFLAQTKAIYTQARTINSDMDKNEAEQLELLQDLFGRRQETIEALADASSGGWSKQEQAVIDDIQQMEILLQPLISKLHEKFSVQINRLNQARQASGKYAGAYRQASSGGSFIDQRK